MAEIHTFDAADKLTRHAANLVLEAARESVRMRHRFVWFLSGGTTPAMLYRMLAHEDYASRFPWPETHVFWGDERWVSEDDPQSNARMAKEELLSKVPIPPSQIHPFITIGVKPQDSAAAAERLLRSLFPGSEPRPDMMLLGLGEDGHTASLFPGGVALAETRLLFTAEEVKAIGQWRVTATLPLINSARHVLFLVTGARKAHAVRQVLDARPETIALPASLVRPSQGRLTWLLDKEAGYLLSHTEQRSP